MLSNTHSIGAGRNRASSDKINLILPLQDKGKVTYSYQGLLNSQYLDRQLVAGSAHQGMAWCCLGLTIMDILWACPENTQVIMPSSCQSLIVHDWHDDTNNTISHIVAATEGQVHSSSQNFFCLVETWGLKIITWTVRRTYSNIQCSKSCHALSCPLENHINQCVSSL